jgi:hypothetical protein
MTMSYSLFVNRQQGADKVILRVIASPSALLRTGSAKQSPKRRIQALRVCFVAVGSSQRRDWDIISALPRGAVTSGAARIKTPAAA